MRIVIFGLTMTSAWENGHATLTLNITRGPMAAATVRPGGCSRRRIGTVKGYREAVVLLSDEMAVSGARPVV